MGGGQITNGHWRMRRRRYPTADLVHAQVGQNVTFRLVIIRLSYVGKYGAGPRVLLILSDAIFLLQKISKFVNTVPHTTNTTTTTRDNQLYGMLGGSKGDSKSECRSGNSTSMLGSRIKGFLGQIKREDDENGDNDGRRE